MAMITRRQILLSLQRTALLMPFVPSRISAAHIVVGNQEQLGRSLSVDTDDATKLRNFITAALAGGVPAQLAETTYILRSPLVLKSISGRLDIQGSGIGKTKIILADAGAYIRFEANLDDGPLSQFSLRDLSIIRCSKSVAMDTRHHSLAVAGFKKVRIFSVEESGASGWGVTASQCEDVTISRCYIHDHVGGSRGQTGTDGINVYQSSNVTITHNRVCRVGDDPISVGSYNPNMPCNHFAIQDNDCSDTRGSIKVYGISANGVISNNRVYRGLTGGVGIWDDRPGIKSSGISNIVIEKNTIVDCGVVGASGGIFLYNSQGPTMSSRRQYMKNISIKDNYIVGGRYGISAFSEKDVASTKLFSGIFISGNVIDKQIYGKLSLAALKANLS